MGRTGPIVDPAVHLDLAVPASSNPTALYATVSYCTLHYRRCPPLALTCPGRLRVGCIQVGSNWGRSTAAAQTTSYYVHKLRER